MSPTRPRLSLSPLEHEVMEHLWRRGDATAEDVVTALRRPLKNATVRTLLRRLEAKGYVGHHSRGRAYVYAARVDETRAATGAIRRIVQRFFGGSSSKLLIGLVDGGLIDPRELRALSRKLARRAPGQEKRKSD
jgi:predicted transcriptional regulator